MSVIELCNASERPLIVWLEPWAQEFALPGRALLTLKCTAEEPRDPTPEIELSEEVLTIWGVVGSKITVLIDGVDQESFTASYMAPDLGTLSSKQFVQLVFSGHPEARPGGLPITHRPVARFSRWFGALASRLSGR